MRRALLTAVPDGWPDVADSVGYSTQIGSGFWYDQTNLYIIGGTAAGTKATVKTVLKTLKTYFNGTAGAFDLRFISGALSGTSFTVRDISGPHAIAAGAGQAPNLTGQSLKVDVGDRIGIHLNGTWRPIMGSDGIGGWDVAYKPSTTVPVPTIGSTITGLTIQSSSRLVISGTNP